MWRRATVAAVTAVAAAGCGGGMASTAEGGEYSILWQDTVSDADEADGVAHAIRDAVECALQGARRSRVVSGDTGEAIVGVLDDATVADWDGSRSYVRDPELAIAFNDFQCVEGRTISGTLVVELSSATSREYFAEYGVSYDATTDFLRIVGTDLHVVISFHREPTDDYYGQFADLDDTVFVNLLDEEAERLRGTVTGASGAAHALPGGA